MGGRSEFYGSAKGFLLVTCGDLKFLPVSIDQGLWLYMYDVACKRTLRLKPEVF